MTGKPLDDAHAVIAGFRGMMLDGDTPDEKLLGDGVALEGVRKFPVRIKCAVLSWNTLKLGLDEHATAGGQRVELRTRLAPTMTIHVQYSPTISIRTAGRDIQAATCMCTPRRSTTSPQTETHAESRFHGFTSRHGG